MNNLSVTDIKIEEIANVCRICLSNESAINILYAEYENIPIKNIFETILQDSISTNDKGPISLCQQCLEVLISFYQFIAKYERNKPILQQLNALAQVAETNSNQVSLDNLDIETEDIIHESVDESEEKKGENFVESTIEDMQNDHDYFSSEKVPIKSYVCTLCEFDAEIESPSDPSLGIASHYFRSHFLTIRGARFRCEKCSRYFPSFEKIREHLHSDEHLSKECPICKISFETMEEQYRHVRDCKRKTLKLKSVEKDKKVRDRKQALKESYFCLFCQVYIDTFEEVLQHYKDNMHQLTDRCMLCNESKRNVHSHLFRHKPKRMRFVCIPCHLYFENVEDLAKHRQEVNHLTIKCHLCEKIVRRRYWVTHLKEHKSIVDQMICDVCGKVYTNKKNLRRHYMAVHEKRRFYCDKCPASYSVLEALKDHAARKHDEINSKLNRNTEDYRYYSCEHCGKRIYKYHKKSVAVHEAFHKFGHKFICSVSDCMLTFLDEESRQQHKNNDHQSFFCYECENTYFDPNYFRVHTNYHAWKTNCSDPNIPKCWICQNHFPTFEILAMHLKANYGLHMCCRDNCHRVFSRNVTLNQHTSDFHNRSKLHTNRKKSFICNVCNSRFCKSQKLKVHMRTHTGEKPYPCRYCEKMFSQTYNRKIHERLHTGERPYACKYCGKQFVENKSAKKHEAICKKKEDHLEATDDELKPIHLVY